MERKTSSLRFTRGRLAALLSAVVLVTIVVFSLTFYHLCLHAKRMEVLTQGDGRRHGLRRLRMPRHSPERRDHRSHG